MVVAGWGMIVWLFVLGLVGIVSSCIVAASTVEVKHVLSVVGGLWWVVESGIVTIVFVFGGDVGILRSCGAKV